MYWDAPGTVQPSAGYSQTVTAMSEADGEAAGLDGEVAGDAGVAVAGADDVPAADAVGPSPIGPVGAGAGALCVTVGVGLGRVPCEVTQPASVRQAARPTAAASAR